MSQYKKFWEWFQAHEGQLFQFDGDQERVFENLATQLQRVHPNLVFELSGIIEGQREFIVSAAGIKKAFPEVTALVREAPALPRWKVVAFRQRHGIQDIECGDIGLKGEAVFIDYVPNGASIDLWLFLPGLADASEAQAVGYKAVGYLLLDSVVGEYDVETKIAGIKFVDSAALPEKRRIPLRDLPAIVDRMPNSVQ